VTDYAYYVETDFKGVLAQASPVFSQRRYAEQYLKRAQEQRSDFPSRIVEQPLPLPEGWQLMGDKLLAELLKEYLLEQDRDNLGR